jgi:hypothetical protein
MSTRNDDLLIGEPDGLGIRSGDDAEAFDYYLTAPERNEFGFDAMEIADLISLLERTLGNG